MAVPCGDERQRRLGREGVTGAGRWISSISGARASVRSTKYTEQVANVDRGPSVGNGIDEIHRPADEPTSSMPAVDVRG